MPRGVYVRSAKTIEHLRSLAQNRDDGWKQKQSECRLGKALPEETREKMSASHKKRYEDPAERKKTGDSIRGMKRSDETKARMSKPKSESHKQHIADSMEGHKVAQETRDKIAEARNGKFNGENHWNWNGGITPLTKTIRMCFKMEAWRNAVFKRDNYTCQKTGVRGCTLEAHHVVPFSEIIAKHNITTVEEAFACEELWDISNGITLSEDAHFLLHHPTP